MYSRFPVEIISQLLEHSKSISPVFANGWADVEHADIPLCSATSWGGMRGEVSASLGALGWVTSQDSFEVRMIQPIQ